MKHIFKAVIICLFPLTSCHAMSNYKFSYNGKQYEIITQKLSWVNAAKYAVDHNAQLAQIHNIEEQTAIWKAINNSGIPVNYTSVYDGGGIAYIWIGATDRQKEGNWIWDGTDSGNGTMFWYGEGKHGKHDGAPVNNLYNNWGGSSTGSPNEPDNWQNKQNAAAIGLSAWPKGSGVLGHAGEWNDIDDSNELYFIIAYN